MDFMHLKHAIFGFKSAEFRNYRVSLICRRYGTNLIFTRHQCHIFLYASVFSQGNLPTSSHLSQFITAHIQLTTKAHYLTILCSCCFLLASNSQAISNTFSINLSPLTLITPTVTHFLFIKSSIFFYIYHAKYM